MDRWTESLWNRLRMLFGGLSDASSQEETRQMIEELELLMEEILRELADLRQEKRARSLRGLGEAVSWMRLESPAEKHYRIVSTFEERISMSHGDLDPVAEDRIFAEVLSEDADLQEDELERIEELLAALSRRDSLRIRRLATIRPERKSRTSGILARIAHSDLLLFAGARRFRELGPKIWEFVRADVQGGLVGAYGAGMSSDEQVMINAVVLGAAAGSVLRLLNPEEGRTR